MIVGIRQAQNLWKLNISSKRKDRTKERKKKQPLSGLETYFLNYLINIQKISSFALIFFVTTQTIESIELLGSCWLKQ